MDVTNIALCGVSLAVFIQVAVGMAKALGMPVKYAKYMSAGLGILGGIAVAVTEGQSILYGLIAGVFVGAAACGVYDQGKTEVSTGAE